MANLPNKPKADVDVKMTIARAPVVVKTEEEFRAALEDAGVQPGAPTLKVPQ